MGGGTIGPTVVPNVFFASGKPRIALKPYFAIAASDGALVMTPPMICRTRSGIHDDRKCPRTARIPTPIASPMLHG